MTARVPLALHPELLKVLDGKIPVGRTRNDLLHRLLATHPEVNRPDLEAVPRKTSGRPRMRAMAGSL